MTRAITIAVLLDICSPARAGERVSLTMGRFTAAGDYGYSQRALSVKNSRAAARVGRPRMRILPRRPACRNRRR
jgi:hypothetical protein